jgi:hypothetical protein
VRRDSYPDSTYGRDNPFFTHNLTPDQRPALAAGAKNLPPTPSATAAVSKTVSSTVLVRRTRRRRRVAAIGRAGI